MCMRYNGIIAAAALLLIVSCSDGAFERTSNGFKAETVLCNVQVECYSPSIVRVQKYPLGHPCPDVKSYAVVKTPESVSFKVKEGRDGIVTLRTKVLTVSFDTKTSVVEVCDDQGRRLIAEKPGTFVLNPVELPGGDRYHVAQTFILDDDEHIYGLGQHQQGNFDQRGCHVHLEQVNMEVAIPIAHSSKGYALFWDNSSITDFDDSAEGMKFESKVGLKSDYYVIAGGNADGVVAGIRDLTGQVPMLPRWSFGFNQSRERYTSQEEIISVVRRFRELGVPLDGIVQDWQYWSEDHHYWNALRFGNPNYPAPKGMMEDIHAMNAHCLISVWPSMGPGTDVFRDLESEGLLMRHDSFPPHMGVKNYDAYSPRAREIYWDYMKRGIYDAGVDGWWLDATEPERQGDVEEGWDYITADGPYRDVSNAYPLVSTGGVYDSQRAYDSSKRVFILTRSAFAGQQRYGTQVWSGDVVARWDVLAAQIPAAINFSLCGMPYWNCDIGGFYVPGEIYPGGNANAQYHRLYIRWMQLGVFTGMMRSHGTSTPREIYNFGEPGSFDFETQETFINLRYRLLPYIYSASHDVTAKGASLMRPLFAEYPDDEQTYSIGDEFFFGKGLLVAPITTPTDSRDVYLPEGEWIDFWGGAKVTGGVSFKYFSTLDTMPIFVRQGTILPIGPTVMYSDEKPLDSMQIRIYTGADAEYELYEDAGDGYGYEQGESSVIRFAWDDDTQTLSVKAREGSYPGMLQERDFNVVLVRGNAGIGLDNESSDMKVHYNGAEINVTIQ